MMKQYANGKTKNESENSQSPSICDKRWKILQRVPAVARVIHNTKCKLMTA